MTVPDFAGRVAEPGAAKLDGAYSVCVNRWVDEHVLRIGCMSLIRSNILVGRLMCGDDLVGE